MWILQWQFLVTLLFWMLQLLLLLLLIGGSTTILVAMVIVTTFALLALIWLLATNLVDGTLAGSTSDVFCSCPAWLKFLEPLADVSCGEVGFLCDALWHDLLIFYVCQIERHLFPKCCGFLTNINIVLAGSGEVQSIHHNFCCLVWATLTGHTVHKAH